MAITISLIAIIFSAIGLAVSIYSVQRDKGRLIAWSEIVTDEARENASHAIKITLVNSGRRVVVLTSMVKESPTLTWSTPLKNPILEKDNKGYLIKTPDIEDLNAQHTCLVLQEGEIFELIIPYEEHYNDLMFSLEKKMHYATKLYVEDVMKKRHHIKDSSKNIVRFNEYAAKKTA